MTVVYYHENYKSWLLESYVGKMQEFATYPIKSCPEYFCHVPLLFCLVSHLRQWQCG